jgi:glycosyltransferase involved in cell wall biosynthesis
MKTRPRLLRITTVPISLKLLLHGQISFMESQGLEVLALSASGKEVNDLKNAGIRHQSVPMTRKITPFMDLICLFRLIIIIMKFRPHIVHTHTPKAGLLGMLAAKMCFVGIRIHTVAGLPLMESTGLKRSLLKITESITYRCAHHIFPNSKGLMNYITENFKIDSNKIKVIGSGSSNGIDTTFFAPSLPLFEQAIALKKHYSIPDGAVVFCFVGRVVRDKGVNELLKVFNRLSPVVRSYLLLVGPFEDELDPISLESRQILNLNKNVISVGYQSDVRPFMVAADIFVFPTYREGFPNVVLQACSLKIPCIVSDINGNNEIISHHRNGLIVPPKNEEALYEAMLSLANDPDLRKKFGEASRDFVVKNFEQKYIWSKLLTEYRFLMEQRVGNQKTN